jgi:short-subunit dehydrogenase
MNWRDKVVLITGASSGIGRGLALEFARRGAAVGLFARRIDVLQELQADIVRAGGRAISLQGDVTHPDTLRDAACKLTEAFGSIDVMIANAGIGATTRGHNLPLDDVSRIINVNLIGAANSAAAVIPQMVQRGSGRVVAIASLAAYRGLPNSAAYCASKAGVSKLYESLRVDLRGTGVEVTVICPGFVRTRLTANHAKMLFLMDVDVAVQKIVRAIERGKKSYSFPWQLASFVRAGLVFPNWLYDRVALRYAYRR